MSRRCSVFTNSIVRDRINCGLLPFENMRYYYERPAEYKVEHGKVYSCDHLIYSHCTLYMDGDLGLAVIQQRFHRQQKRTWWSEIDPWLVDDIYSQEGFSEYFKKRAGKRNNGLYPTVSVRQIMHALGMRPMQKEPWETVFDRKEV